MAEATVTERKTYDDGIDYPGRHLQKWMDDNGYDIDRVSKETGLFPRVVVGILKGTIPLSEIIESALWNLTGLAGWGEWEDGYEHERLVYKGLSGAPAYQGPNDWWEKMSASTLSGTWVEVTRIDSKNKIIGQLAQGDDGDMVIRFGDDSVHVFTKNDLDDDWWLVDLNMNVKRIA